MPSGSAGGEGGRARGALSPRARRAGNQSRIWWRPLCVVTATLALAIGAGDPAAAAKVRGQRQVASIETRDAGEPLMAVVFTYVGVLYFLLILLLALDLVALCRRLPVAQHGRRKARIALAACAML